MANFSTGDIYVTGDDKLLKKYEYPADRIEIIDFKRAPPAPVEEMISHSIGTTCWDVATEFKSFITGGKDGQVFMRHFSSMNDPNEIKAQAVFSGGITAVCHS